MLLVFLDAFHLMLLGHTLFAPITTLTIGLLSFRIELIYST
jgi:hypothetical protein